MARHPAALLYDSRPVLLFYERWHAAWREFFDFASVDLRSHASDRFSRLELRCLERFPRPAALSMLFRRADRIECRHGMDRVLAPESAMHTFLTPVAALSVSGIFRSRILARRHLPGKSSEYGPHAIQDRHERTMIDRATVRK